MAGFETTPPTPPTPLLSLSLSREELFILKRLLKAKDLAGIDFSWVQVAPDGSIPKEVLPALEAAINSLVARGYLVPLKQDTAQAEPLRITTESVADPQIWKKVGIPTEVLSLVGVCAYGEISVLLSWRDGNGENMLSVHQHEDFTSLNTMPIPGIYQFTALESASPILTTIENILELQEQTALGSSVRSSLLQVSAVNEVRDELSTEPTNNVDQAHFNAAARLLVQGGLPPQTAVSFLQSVEETVTVASITILHRNSDTQAIQQQERLSTVVTPTTCFMIEPGDMRGEMLYIQPASADDIRQWVTKSLASTTPAPTNGHNGHSNPAGFSGLFRHPLA